MVVIMNDSITRRIVMNGIIYQVYMGTTSQNVNYVSLLSADNYVLTDKNGRYIMAKEDN